MVQSVLDHEPEFNLLWRLDIGPLVNHVMITGQHDLDGIRLQAFYRCRVSPDDASAFQEAAPSWAAVVRVKE